MLSGVRTEDEGLYVVQHEYWQRDDAASAVEAEACRSPKGSLTMTDDSRERGRAFLYREARFLDDRECEEWLEFYAPDAEFWMPAWDDDDTLVDRPAAPRSR